MPEFPAPVRDLVARQDGVVTRAQLLEHGVTAAAVRWNPGRSWRVLLPAVYLVRRDVTVTDRHRQIAALLWAGDTAALAGLTAARLLGVTAADPRQRIHVVVPAPLSSRRRGFADVRRSTLHDPDVVVRGVIRISGPARSVVDAARAAGSADVAAAILIEAVQRGITDLTSIEEWVHRLRPRDAAALHGPLEEAATGAWSRPEATLLALVAGSRTLPPAWANPRLESPTGDRLTTPDAWFDDVAMAVMVHSHRHHSQGEDWDATVDQDGDLVAAGVVVAGVTPTRIAREPERVLERIENTYRVARARPRPAVTATPRHVIARLGRAG